MRDADEYLDEMERMKSLIIEKPPPARPPVVNLQKLAFEKKIVPIILDIRISEHLVIKDKFDWDLNELQSVSPARFASAIGELLNIPNKESEVLKMQNSIIDQILIYIEKNTFFPRVRFCKREEEIIAEGQICVNCDSLLKNAEICDNCGFSFERKFPGERLDDLTVSHRQTERQRSLEETRKTKNFLSAINNLGVLFLDKEKKKCKSCNLLNPFFLNNCKNCRTKFQKKGKVQRRSTQFYSMYFWEVLCLKPEFACISDLQEEDFDDTFTLYNKLKFLLKQKNLGSMLDLSEVQMSELENSLLETYHLLMTQNEFTERIFWEAEYYKMTGRYRRGTEDILRFENILAGSESLGKEYTFRYRAHNLENKYINSGQGSLNPNKQIAMGLKSGNMPNISVTGVNATSRFMNKLKKGESYLGSRGDDQGILMKMGAPNVDLTPFHKRAEFENMIQYKSYDHLPSLLNPNAGIIREDGLNMEYCGACGTPGTLIFCDNCPSSFHIECLGFERSPRGQWRCYFCKVIREGILHVHKLSPREKNICFELKKNVQTWEERAKIFITILKQHPCSHNFLEAVSTSMQEYYQKIQYPMDLGLITRMLDDRKYPKVKTFLNDVRRIWSNAKIFYEENSLLYNQAESLEKLFHFLYEKERIFAEFENINSSDDESINFTGLPTKRKQIVGGESFQTPFKKPKLS